MAPLINANPVIYSQTPLRSGIVSESDLDDLVEDPLSALEVYELLCHINDPEHPHSLSALNVVQESLIQVDLVSQSITVRFTPTIPHCSMATLIGLCLRVRLLRSLPRRFKLEIRVTEGSHQSEAAGIFVLFVAH